MKVIKYFESFTEEIVKKLEQEHKIYLKRISKEIINYSEDFQIIRNKIKNYDIFSDFNFYYFLYCALFFW